MNCGQPSPAARGWTGGAASASGLVLATIEQEGGPAVLDRARSAEFILAGDDQQSLGRFHDEIAHFVAAAGLKRVLLRVAQKGGPHAAASKTVAVETVLQLVPGLAIERVNRHSLDRWASTLAADPALETISSNSERRALANAMSAARASLAIEQGEISLVNQCLRRPAYS